MLTWIAVITLVALVANGAKDGLSIAKGREAPSMEKYKMRHSRGQNLADAMGHLTARKKSGKPAGALTVWRRAVVSNTAHMAAEKAEHRHHRRIQWYRDHGAALTDEKWHARQQTKLRKQQQKIHKFKIKKGLIQPDPVPSTVDSSTVEPQPEQPEPQPEKPDLTAVADLDERRTRKDNDEQRLDKQSVRDYPNQGPFAEHPMPDPTPIVSTTNGKDTKAVSTMYDREAEDLLRRADNIGSYRRDLGEFADGLSSDWGTEVVGPVQEMDTPLREAEEELRQLAADITVQGNAVKSAYEQAPFAPDRAALRV